jgi:hypothetical protein
MNEFISGYNFARKSDVVFSEVLPDISIFIADKFNLDNGQIIFCKIDYLEILFNILRDENELSNIKLITHEGDIGIGKDLFFKKPKCISNWYAQNVEYDHPNLIPIPIGLANDYCKITLKINHLSSQKKHIKNKKLLYINHRISTCPSARGWIYNYFKTNDWCTIDNSNLSLEEYKLQLDNHKFILCPRGNGIDTHRLWESLYHGIIPIVEHHIHYEKCLIDLPVIIINSFKDITKEFLEFKYIEIQNKQFNMNKLNVNWWIEKIKNHI